MTVFDASEIQAPPIRIQILNITGLRLEVLIALIQRQPDMVLLNHRSDSVEWPTVLGEQTDVIIIGAPYLYPHPSICKHLWRSFPKLKVLVLTPDSGAAMVYWLGVRRHRINTISPRRLAGLIRSIHRVEITAP